MGEFPAWLSATLASDASGGRGVLPLWIRSLRAESRAVGPAFVALASQDDNLSVRAALAAPPPPGSVLVVAGGSTSRTAMMGGLMALEMQNAGIVAVITDGLIRDAGEIRQLQLGIWCRGVTPAAPRKNGPALIGGTVCIAGVIIRAGDLVIADEDGVVIWPQEDVVDLLARAEARLQQDNARLGQLQKGKK